MTPQQFKQRRERLGLTRTELATLLDLPIRTYEKWEQGTTDISFRARLLDLALRYLEEHPELTRKTA